MQSNLLYISAVFCCALSVVLGQQLNLDSLIQRANAFANSGQLDFGLRNSGLQVQQQQQQQQQQQLQFSSYCGNPFDRFSRFAGYENAGSDGRYPLTNASKVALLQWNTTDTNDWYINPFNSTELVLRNPGVWTINLKAFATLFALQKAKLDAITESFMQVVLIVNGNLVPSAFDQIVMSTYAETLDSLSISYTSNFCAGDRLQVVVASSSPENAFFYGGFLSMAETSYAPSCRSSSCSSRSSSCRRRY